MSENTVKETDWLTKGIPESQLKAEKILSLISAQIYTKRTHMGMNEDEFAKYLGVTAQAISLWESGEHDFSISTLCLVCEKLSLSLVCEIGS